MVGGWLPNLQKRMLLYLLHQLLVFSDIDMPNLTQVSLNGIVLNQVTLDPDKVMAKIGDRAPFHLRHGVLGHFALSPDGGGVAVEALEIDVVLALLVGDASIDDLEASIAELLLGMLALLQAQLARVLEEDDPLGVAVPPTAAAPGGVVGGVVARAVEIALARLRVTLHRLRCKLVFALKVEDVVVEIDRVHYAVADTKRVTVEGVRVVCGLFELLAPALAQGLVHSDVDPSLMALTMFMSAVSSPDEGSRKGLGMAPNPLARAAMEKAREDGPEGSTIESSSDLGPSPSPPLNFSLATPEPPNPVTALYVSLVTIDIPPVEPLRIEVAEVKVALQPACSLASQVCEAYTHHYKCRDLRRKRDVQVKAYEYPPRFPQYHQSDSLSSGSLQAGPTTTTGTPNEAPVATDPQPSKFSLGHLKVATVVVTNGTIHPDGTTSHGHLEAILTNTHVKKRDDSVFGGVEIVKVGYQGHENTVFWFEDDGARRKADVRFESHPHQDTVYLAKPIRVRVDEASTRAVAGVVLAVFQTVAAYQTLVLAMEKDSHQCEKEEDPIPLVVQTAETIIEAIVASIDQNDDQVFSLLLSPFHYHSGKLAASIRLAELSVNSVPIAWLTSLVVHTDAKEFSTVAKRLWSETTAVVEDVRVQMLYNHVDLLKTMASWWPREPSRRDKPPPPPARPGTSLGGLILKPGGRADWRASLKRVLVMVSDLTPWETVLVDTTSWLFYSQRGKVMGHVRTVVAQRLPGPDEPPYETMVSPLWLSPPAGVAGTPMVQFTHREGKIEIQLTNVLGGYWTYWMGLSDRDDKSTESSLSSEEINPPMKDSQESLSPEKLPSKLSPESLAIRVNTTQCALGLTPGRLLARAYVHWDRGVVDILSGVYVKSSIHSMALWLIDEAPVLKPTVAAPFKALFAEKSYLRVATVSMAHYGMVGSSVKINVDKVVVDVCADSFEVLIALISDLNIPTTYTNSQRFRTELEQPINLLEGLGLLGEGNSEKELAEEPKSQPMYTSMLNIQENYVPVTAEPAKEPRFRLHLNVADIKLYMFDGYDWSDTRRQIRARVKEMEGLARKKRSRRALAEPEKKEEIKETPEAKEIPFPLSGVGSPAPEGFTLLSGLEEIEADKTEEYEALSPPRPPRELPIIEETLFSSIHMIMLDPGEFADLVRHQLYGEKKHKRKSKGNRGRKIEDTHQAIRFPAGATPSPTPLGWTRSSQHKVYTHALGLEVDVAVYDDTPQAPTRLELEVLIDDLSVYDNVATLTWTKALGYQSSKGPKELGTSMVTVQMATVRADSRLEGSAESFLSVKVLPMRLHLDHDTVAFAQRFFGFSNPRFSLPDDGLFFSKVAIGPIKAKVDYKPKAPQGQGVKGPSLWLGLVVIDGAKISLDPVKVYGTWSLALGTRLVDQGWAPQLRRNYGALFGVMLGLGPFKLLVNIGDGLKDLVVVPYTEYRRDRSILRGIRHGTRRFAQKTGGELLSLGAKLALGTTTLLMQAEKQWQPTRPRDPPPAPLSGSDSDSDDTGFFDVGQVPSPRASVMASSQVLSQRFSRRPSTGFSARYTYDELDELEDESDLMHKLLVLLDPVGTDEVDEVAAGVKKVLLYLNQPETIEEGIQAAYKAMGSNLGATKRVLLRLKDDVGDAESVQEALITVIRSSPLVLIHPIIGTTEALGKTLMGMGNTVDPNRVVEARDKYGKK